MNAASRTAGRIAAAEPGDAVGGPAAPAVGPADVDPWSVLEAVGDGVLVLERVADSSLRIVWASASFHALAGLGPLAGRTPDFVRCHDTQRPLGELLASADGEPLQRARLDIDTASWRRVAAASIRRNGTRHVVSLTLDAIDWHALTALELPFGMLVFSPDMRVRWANEAAAADAGMPRERLVGSDWYALVPGAITRAELAAAIDRALASGEPWEIDCELETTRGRRWLRSTGRVERVGGRVLRIYGSSQDIDALKRTQVRLQQRSDWLQLAIDAAKLTVWRWDVAGERVTVEYASDGMQRDGAPQPTVEGWLSLVHPDDRARLRESLLRTKDAGTLTDEEFRMQRPPDGGYGWFVARAVRVQEPEGLVVTGTTSDITERRRAEDDVRASEATLRSIAEHSPDVVTIVDPRLRIVFTNRPPPGSLIDEVVGRPAREFAVGHGALLERNLRHVLATGESRTYSSWRFDADDQPRYYEHRIGPIRAGREIRSAIVFSTDVTERIRAERRLRTQASVLATMREGVAVLDASGVVRLTNAAFDRMFGHEPGALDGRGFETLTDGGALPPVEAGQADFEFVGLRADGTRFDAAAAASALELGGERHDVYVVQDVTERRTLERELLEISNREQRRIGSDLHDGLGQELTGIALLLKVMAGRAKRSIAPTAAEIEEVISLVNGAIEDTRALARGLSPVDLERGGLVYALRLLASRAKDLYGVDVRFRTRLPAPLTLAPAATTHLYRIAQEALTNAARHAQAEHVLVQLASRGRSVTLSITDDGRGVADGVALRTGMGLRIMRYRAHMMNGEVVVEAAAPRGTRVVCRVTQPEAAAHAADVTP